jgi:hypothetical protein
VIIVAAGGLGLGPGRVGQGSDSRRQLGGGGGGNARARRQLLARRACAHDIGFDHDVARAADHQEMLDIVAPDQDQAPSSVDSGSIDHGKAWHPPAIRVGTEAIARESAEQQPDGPDQGQHGHQCKDNCHRLHCSVPGKSRFRQAFRAVLTRSSERRLRLIP